MVFCIKWHSRNSEQEKNIRRPALILLSPSFSLCLSPSFSGIFHFFFLSHKIGARCVCSFDFCTEFPLPYSVCVCLSAVNLPVDYICLTKSNRQNANFLSRILRIFLFPISFAPRQFQQQSSRCIYDGNGNWQRKFFRSLLMLAICSWTQRTVKLFRRMLVSAGARVFLRITLNFIIIIITVAVASVFDAFKVVATIFTPFCQHSRLKPTPITTLDSADGGNRQQWTKGALLSWIHSWMLD